MRTSVFWGGKKTTLQISQWVVTIKQTFHEDNDFESGLVANKDI